MQQSSFVLSNKQYGSINIQRKDVNDQQFTIFQNQKTTKKKVKDKGVNSYKPLAKTTHSPKLPRTQQITPKQFPLEDCLSKNQAYCRASDDICDISQSADKNTYYSRNLHMRSNIMTKSPVLQQQKSNPNSKSPIIYQNKILKKKFNNLHLSN